MSEREHARSVHPLAKLAAALVVAVVLLVSLDAVTAGVALAAELALLPFAGVPVRALLARTWPLVLAAAFGGFVTVLYGVDSGAVLARAGFATVTEGSLALGGVIALRILAAGLPAVVLFVTVDPTELADGLAQVLHLPARFVLGALAGLRLVGLLVEDWRSLALARRARGVADRGVLRRLLGQSFALLVLGVRRGSALATAMEAKGFGGTGPRTWARESRMHAVDGVVVAIAVAVVAAAVSVSVATGSWRWVLG